MTKQYHNDFQELCGPFKDRAELTSRQLRPFSRLQRHTYKGDWDFQWKTDAGILSSAHRYGKATDSDDNHFVSCNIMALDKEIWVDNVTLW